MIRRKNIFESAKQTWTCGDSLYVGQDQKDVTFDADSDCDCITIFPEEGTIAVQKIADLIDEFGMDDLKRLRVGQVYSDRGEPLSYTIRIR